MRLLGKLSEDYNPSSLRQDTSSGGRRLPDVCRSAIVGPLGWVSPDNHWPLVAAFFFAVSWGFPFREPEKQPSPAARNLSAKWRGLSTRVPCCLQMFPGQ